MWGGGVYEKVGGEGDLGLVKFYLANILGLFWFVSFRSLAFCSKPQTYFSLSASFIFSFSPYIAHIHPAICGGVFLAGGGRINM